ncbi:MAG: amidinotransferase [Dysgonamonadaceae bacterium]|jgi:hypothetical protein|nr:amidinotransferase [Dysgonamonadaceae bacterium]
MIEKQSANTLLMIEPVAFGFNHQTAKNNFFQQKSDEPASLIQDGALKEFTQMTAVLGKNGFDLTIVKDTIEPHTPDSIFPNNWISFHADGRVAIYPMFAANRRLERRTDIWQLLEKKGFIVREIVDYSPYEKECRFLEGTGSMTLDRENQTAYAALSERTDKTLFLKFCSDFHFTPCYFTANQTVGNKRQPVYHTNVMMSVADRYAVVCLESVDDETERQKIIHSLSANRKEIIEITENQMHRFAGNILQIENRKGEKFSVMSETAYRSLTEKQIKQIAVYNSIIRIPVPTIEKQGGGSVRCMIAEIFLQKNKRDEDQ